MNDFAPVAEEYEQIDQEYKRLANSGQSITATQQTLELLSKGEETNLLSQLHTARHVMSELITLDPSLSEVMAQYDASAAALAEAVDLARQLHQRRIEHACSLVDHITHSIRELALPHSKLAIDVHFQPELLNADSVNRVEFMVTTNPGPSLQPLAKVGLRRRAVPHRAGDTGHYRP